MRPIEAAKAKKLDAFDTTLSHLGRKLATMQQDVAMTVSIITALNFERSQIANPPLIDESVEV